MHRCTNNTWFQQRNQHHHTSRNLQEWCHSMHSCSLTSLTHCRFHKYSHNLAQLCQCQLTIRTWMIPCCWGGILERIHTACPKRTFSRLCHRNLKILRPRGECHRFLWTVSQSVDWLMKFGLHLCKQRSKTLLRICKVLYHPPPLECWSLLANTSLQLWRSYCPWSKISI